MLKQAAVHYDIKAPISPNDTRMSKIPNTKWRRDMQAVFDDVVALQRELVPASMRALFRVSTDNGFKILYLRHANESNVMVDTTTLGDMSLHPEWCWPDDARVIVVRCKNPRREMRIYVGKSTLCGRVEYLFHDGNGMVEYSDGVRNALKRIGFY